MIMKTTSSVLISAISAIYSVRSSAEDSAAAGRLIPMLLSEEKLFRQELQFRLKMQQRAVKERLILTALKLVLIAMARAQKQVHLPKHVRTVRAEAT